MAAPQDYFVPLYGSQFLSDQKVARLPLDALGLLVKCWAAMIQDGYLPANLDDLAKILKVNPRTVRSLWPLLESFFAYGYREHDGVVRGPFPGSFRAEFELNSSAIQAEFRPKLVLLSPRIQAERERQFSRKARGRIAAKTRWLNEMMLLHPDASASLPTDAQASEAADACASVKHQHMRMPPQYCSFTESDQKEEKKELPKEERTTPPPKVNGTAPMAGKRVRDRRVVTTWLKAESVEAFERCWDNVPPSKHKDRLGNEVLRVVRGDRLPAERVFQMIVDAKAATPDELWRCWKLYVDHHPKVKEGYVQHLSTFFNTEQGRWAEALRHVRKQSAPRQEEPHAAVPA